jgi:predicted DNA-binding antitoxin AbrB/MazE fold protein
MILNIEATFENGVFVPVKKPAIAEHQRVRLFVEAIAPAPQCQPDEEQHPTRIRLEPSAAEEIALSAEFQPENS